MEDVTLITPPPAVSSILEETARMGFGMASEPLVGGLLRVLAASKRSGRFLELGTGTGVATWRRQAPATRERRWAGIPIDSASVFVRSGFRRRHAREI